jgi:biopolymer transport protein TolQ
MSNSMFAGNMVWHLVGQADFMSKLVLLTLLGMSIWCWSIVLYKALVFRRHRRQLERASALLKQVTLEELPDRAIALGGTLGGAVVAQMLLVVRQQLETGEAQFTPSVISHIEDHAQQAIDDIMVTQENQLPVLATSAAVAPLVGLFGTVWGLIHAFIGISQSQSADIAAVAPGIAEALITTLAGLVVAIPALVMYSYLSIQIRILEKGLCTVADRLIFALRRQRGVR